MDTRAAIRTSLEMSDMIVKSYLGDLTDADLLVRPIKGVNHIAWQLGHLLTSENAMINGVRPGSLPPLPAGFAEKFTKETASVDDPAAFPSKQEFLELYTKQRQGTLAALDATSDAEMDQPAPEKFRSFLKNVGATFAMQGSHWLMHAGQWAVYRRHLGKPPLF